MNKIAFTVADETNKPHAEKMINSLHKFHPDLEVIVFNEKDVGEVVNYYKATPMFARELIKEYDVVLKLDADQIITGNLDYLFDEDYDVGTVLNYNRVDSKVYDPVGVWNVSPEAYMNCGLVAMKNQEFIDHWWMLCNKPYFNMFRYREQDLLNILVEYGNYTVECFDIPNKIKDYDAWHGLVSKGEYDKMVMKDGELILPVGEDDYPKSEKVIKVLNSAGI